MPRGGKRPGAGRKRVLTDLERLFVGAKCERLYIGKIDSRLSEKVSEATTNLRGEQELLRHETGEAQVRVPSDDLEDVLRLDQKLAEDEKPKKGFRVVVTRPKGVRNEILERVALDTGLTTSMVNRCWKAYRKMLREDE